MGRYYFNWHYAYLLWKALELQYPYLTTISSIGSMVAHWLCYGLYMWTIYLWLEQDLGLHGHEKLLPTDLDH